MAKRVKLGVRLAEKVSDRWWLAICMALSGTVQLSFISKASVWHDEGYSLMLAPQSIGQIVARTARDVHPPLYYFALHFWMQLFGSSELAVRSLSTVAILGSIAVMFLIIKRLFGSGAARLAVLVMGLAPFLIRYGQEARMYALVAFWVTLATYLLVRALDEHNLKLLYAYSGVMALALYTHYYAIFIVGVHWLYVLLRTKGRASSGALNLKSWHWWLANLLILALFGPWLPKALSQFTRVQGAFWIPPVSVQTLPATLAQWLSFTDMGKVAWLRAGVFIATFALLVLAIRRDRLHRRSLILVASWAWFPPVAIFLASVAARPIYVDRYFVYSSVAFYGLLVVLLYVKPLNLYTRVRQLLIAILLVTMTIGIQNVYSQASHRMRDIGEIVSQEASNGDQLVAGELYVYFDFSYYNHTNLPLYLYAPSGVSGYGETGLLYDRPQLILASYAQLSPASGYVWVIGKAGTGDFDAVPPSWKLAAHFQAGESVANRYLIPALAKPVAYRQ